MVRHNTDLRPFVSRVYQRNIDIESSLVKPCIADIDRRQGVVHRFSCLDDEKKAIRSDVRQYDRLCKQISQHRIRGEMEARAQEHDRIIRNALNAADMQQIDVLDGPFRRRFMPTEASRAHSNHAFHLKMMEGRRLQDVYDAWEATKDDERRMRARKLFRPLEVTAIPEMPYHRAYRNPSKCDL